MNRRERMNEQGYSVMRYILNTAKFAAADGHYEAAINELQQLNDAVGREMQRLREMEDGREND